MSHPMMVFSFRTPLELVRKFKKKAKKEKKSAGELLREIIETTMQEEKMNQEQEFRNYAMELIGHLPMDRAKELLHSGDPEAMRPYLVGTKIEPLLGPGNSRFFGSVCAVGEKLLKSSGSGRGKGRRSASPSPGRRKKSGRRPGSPGGEGV